MPEASNPNSNSERDLLKRYFKAGNRHCQNIREWKKSYANFHFTCSPWSECKYLTKHSSSHFFREILFLAFLFFGHFWHFQVPENGTLSARIQKRRPLFHANIHSKWWNRLRLLFYSFTTFGRVIG